MIDIPLWVFPIIGFAFSCLFYAGYKITIAIMKMAEDFGVLF